MLLRVLVAALALRAVMFVAYRSSVLAGYYAIDTLYYRTWALRLAAGERAEAGVFEQSPLYAYLLGGVFRVFGPSEPAAIAIQMLCGLATVALLLDAARRVFGGRAALATGMIAAAYGPFLLHECLLMKTFLEPLFVTASLWAALRFGEERRRRWAAVAGLAIGLAVLVREVHVLLLAPLAIALAGAGRGSGMRRRAAGPAVLLLAFAATILPATARNYALSGELTLVTAAGGENLYLAYGPEAAAFYPKLPFVTAAPHREHEDFREEASLRAGRLLTRGEASGFWYRETVRTLLADPARAARLCARKVLMLLQDYEVPDSEDYSVARGYLPFLWALPTFGWVFGLGLVGLTALVPARRGRAPLVLMAAFLVAEVALTFNLARYRLAMTAVWLVPAGAAVAWLIDSLQEHRRVTVKVAMACAVVAAATAFSFTRPPVAFPVASLAAHERRRLEQAARRAESLPALRAAAGAEPGNPVRWMELAAKLHDQGLLPEAVATYERVLRDAPGLFVARWALATMYEEEGRLRAAIDQLRYLVRGSPSDVGARHRLGRLLLRRIAAVDAATAAQLADEALVHLREALRLYPEHSPSLYEIGRMLHLRGRTGTAVEVLEHALQVSPGYGDAAHLLAIIRARDSPARQAP